MTDWPTYCDHQDLEVAKPRVWVSFPNGRQQKVRVYEQPDDYRLESTVAGRTRYQDLLANADPDTIMLRLLRQTETPRS